MIHIESRKASNGTDMCEFFSEIEIENSNLEKLVTSLKKEVENLQLGEEEPHSPRPPVIIDDGRSETI